METGPIPDESRPRVSILLPTFNRAGFLPQALDAIRAQTYGAWELVIVDDGSTDDTPRVVEELRGAVRQPIHYVWQTNAGAYAARNRALDLATAPYVAFYDSDDIWLPQHLENCVRALDENPDVDWVYSASRIVDHDSRRVIMANSFVSDGQPQPFRRLHTTTRGTLHVIDDPRQIELAIFRGLYSGLQNSVIRAAVFLHERFHLGYCDVDGKAASIASSSSAEDQLFAIRVLKRGHRLGYIDDVHVEYHVHDANSSAAATTERTVERQLLTYGPLARGFEELQAELTFTPREQRALARRLAREYFWHIGYTVFWMNGRHAEAIQAFRRGLQFWPWSPRCWKTYALARLRIGFGQARA